MVETSEELMRIIERLKLAVLYNSLGLHETKDILLGNVKWK